MNNDYKYILLVIFGTLILIVGGIFVVSLKSNTNNDRVDEKILIRNDSAKIASSSATVNLVEFSDFQCPACGLYHPLVKQVLSEFKGKINFVYRHFPLSQHQNAQIAAYAVEAAGRQGKFWEMYDRVFESQAKWSEEKEPLKIFEGYIKDLSLDVEKFNTDVVSREVAEKVEKDRQDGFSANVNSTPTFFLDGKKLDNPKSYEELKNLINQEIKIKTSTK